MYNFLSLNFGEIEAAKSDLWDCLKPNALNILISIDNSEVYFQISDDILPLKKCACLETAFIEYAEFVESKGIMAFSNELLLGLMQCVYDEDIDAMYQIITNQGGKIEFVNDRDFNFSDGVLDQIAIEYPNAPLCMIQTAEIDVIINEHKIIYNGNSVELKDLFGCIDYFDARSCVFTKDKTTFLS